MKTIAISIIHTTTILRCTTTILIKMKDILTWVVTLEEAPWTFILDRILRWMGTSINLAQRARRKNQFWKQLKIPNQYSMALRDSLWSNLILMRIWRPQCSMVPGLRPCDQPRSWQELWKAQIMLSWFSASTNPRAFKESRGWKKLRTQHSNQNYSSINHIQAWGTLPCIIISASWATLRYLGSWNAPFHSEN